MFLGNDEGLRVLSLVGVCCSPRPCLETLMDVYGVFWFRLVGCNVYRVLAFEYGVRQYPRLYGVHVGCGYMFGVVVFFVTHSIVFLV